MMTLFTNARLVTPERVVPGGIAVEGGYITRVFTGAPDRKADQVVDCDGAYLSPGFVDIHVHGCFGAMFDEDPDALERAVHYHSRHGTTSILPTTASAPPESVLATARNIARAVGKDTGGARVLGIHLEGCYFNPVCAGAQNPAFLFPAHPDNYMPLIETGAVRRVSASPEVEGVPEMARRLSKEGILMSVAHSNADYDGMMAALDSGFTHVTHIYNALSMLSNCYYYPQVGVCEAALLHDEFTVEAICDGRHVPAPLLRLIHKIKGPDRFHAVTDAVFSGAPDGPCSEYGMDCLVEDEVCMLADRSAFAGSVATTDRLLRTLVFDAHIPVCDAVKMLTLTPAQQIRQPDIGRLAPGMRADLNIFQDDLALLGTWINGKRITE